MSHHGQPLDLFVRELPLVTDEQALQGANPDTRTLLLEQIVDQPALPAGGRRSRGRRATLVLVAAIALAGLAAVAWAVVNALGAATMAACHTDGDPRSGVGIDLVTGDPVADCAAIWEQDTGQPVPPLIAYDNGTGGIGVLPADVEAPEGWQPLEQGAAQDPRVIELRVALDDQIAGLPSACHDADTGRALVQRELDRLGLTGWSIATGGGDLDGTGTCSYFRLDPARARVVLYPREGLIAPDDAPHVTLAQELATAIDRDCLDLTAAAHRTRQIAENLGIPNEGLVVNEIVDDNATCTRVHINVFGRIEVALHGPESTP